MTSQNGFDRTLSDWLAAENAPDVPDWVYEGAFAEVRTTGQSRPMADALTRWLRPRDTLPGPRPQGLGARPTVSFATPVILVVALLIVALVRLCSSSGRRGCGPTACSRPTGSTLSARSPNRRRHARDTDRAARRPSLAHQRHQPGCLRPGNRPVRSRGKPPLGQAGRVGHAPARRHGADRRRRRR